MRHSASMSMCFCVEMVTPHYFVVTMSWNGNIFRVTGPLWGQSTDHRWIPLTKARYAVLWCFLWSAPEQTAEQTIDTLVIWDAITLIMTSLQWIKKSPRLPAYETQTLSSGNGLFSIRHKTIAWACEKMKHLSIYLRVYSLHHNVLPTLQSIPLMTNGPLYPITQDSSCHGQHTMPQSPWSFPWPVPHSSVCMNVCVLQWRRVCAVVL